MKRYKNGLLSVGGGNNYTVHSSVWTEPNLQVLGSVQCEGGPDPYLQVQGPGVSGLDLRVEPGSDLVQMKCKEIAVSQ